VTMRKIADHADQLRNHVSVSSDAACLMVRMVRAILLCDLRMRS
jgi:hypothetical protein